MVLEEGVDLMGLGLVELQETMVVPEEPAPLAIQIMLVVEEVVQEEQEEQQVVQQEVQVEQVLQMLIVLVLI
jgi:hypothetical protein